MFVLAALYQFLSLIAGNNLIGKNNIPDLSQVINEVEWTWIAQLFAAASETAWKWISSLLIALTIGTVLGVLLGSNKKLLRWTSFIVDFLRSLPATVLALYAIVVTDTFFSRNLPAIYIVTFLVLYYVSQHVQAFTEKRSKYLRGMGGSWWFLVTNLYRFELRHAVGVAIKQATPVALLVTVSTELIFGGNLNSPGLGQLVFSLMNDATGFDARLVHVVMLLGIMGYIGTLAANYLQEKFSYENANRSAVSREAASEHMSLALVSQFSQKCRHYFVSLKNKICSALGIGADILFQTVPASWPLIRWIGYRFATVINVLLCVFLFWLTVFTFEAPNIVEVSLFSLEEDGSAFVTTSAGISIHVIRLLLCAVVILIVMSGFVMSLVSQNWSKMTWCFGFTSASFLGKAIVVYSARVLVLSFFIYYALHATEIYLFKATGRGGLVFVVDSLIDLVRRAVILPLGPSEYFLLGASHTVDGIVTSLAAVRFITVTFLVGTFAVLVSRDREHTK